MKKKHGNRVLFYYTLKKTFIVMRMVLFLLFVSVFQTIASEGYSQSSKITLKSEALSLVDVLRGIEDQSKFRFIYDKSQINLDKKVRVDYDGATVKKVMEELFVSHGVSYQMINNQIILTNSNSEILQDQKRISGKVTDSSGIPLPGVSVAVKGTTRGTITDSDGNYSLTNVSSDAVLVFSFVGMKMQEIQVSGNQTINVKLTEETLGIEEVVAIGYGTKRRADITGSISVVDSEELATLPSRSAGAALQGLAAGVTVINQGAPGAGSKILIRGVTNFGNTDPLVIIDGIEQSINNISASDIESIQILKDAGSAAIYGVRGANGVILVTTKKGIKEGVPMVEYDGSYSMKYPVPGNPLNLVNSQEYMQVYNVAFPGNTVFAKGMPDYMYRGPMGAGVAMEGDAVVDPSLYVWESPNQGKNYIIQKVNKEGTDWFHEMFKKAPTHDHKLSVRGGGQKSRYLFGVGYFDEQGTMVKSYYKRYSLRVNSDFEIGKNIRLGENIYTFHEDQGPVGSSNLYGLPPTVPLKDIAGNWGGSFGGPELGDPSNHVASQYLAAKNNINNQWHVIGNLFGEIDFLKDFTARTSLGFNTYNTYNQNFDYNRPENTAGHASLNALTVESSYGSTITFTNTLQYEKEFGKHKLDALIGSEAIKFTGRGLSGSRKDYFTTDFNFLVLQNASQSISNSSSISSNSLFSVFGRLDYAYDNKYLLTGTIRRDGSSKFGSQNRYGIFPSFSLAWRISQEEFMKNLTWLNDFKLRGSWGILGSQNNVPADNAYSLFASNVNANYYDITGTGTSAVQGWSRSRLGNSITGWEENIVTNIGMDMVLLDNTLDVSVEWYKKKIEGLLFSEPLPAVLGYEATAPMINIGDIQNTGVDASVTHRGKIGNELNYSVRANITSYKNEVVDIPDPGYFDGGSHQAFGSMVRNEIGHPVSSFFGYKFIGLFNSQEEVTNAPTQSGAAPGRLKFEDIKDDGIISPEDRTHLGDPNPDFTYGINIGLKYRNFDFSAFFYGSQGNEIFNANRSYLEFVGFYTSFTKSRKLLNAWTPENTNTNVPKVESVNSFSTFGAVSSYFIEDGSYLKLKSMVLGYTMTPAVLERIGISKLRLYVQAANVFTITNYSGLDPELVGGSTSVRGVDDGTYPKTELNLILGVNVTF